MRTLNVRILFCIALHRLDPGSLAALYTMLNARGGDTRRGVRILGRYYPSRSRGILL